MHVIVPISILNVILLVREVLQQDRVGAEDFFMVLHIHMEALSGAFYIIKMCIKCPFYAQRYPVYRFSQYV